MPTMNPIILTDVEAVAHTFNPRGFDSSGTVATFVESSGVPAGDRRLTVSRSRTTQGREKTTFKMTLPVVQNSVVDGISRPTIVRTAYCEVSFSFDGTSNTTERSNMRVMAVDLLGEAVAGYTVDGLEYLY